MWLVRSRKGNGLSAVELAADADDKDQSKMAVTIASIIVICRAREDVFLETDLVM